MLCPPPKQNQRGEEHSTLYIFHKIDQKKEDFVIFIEKNPEECQNPYSSVLKPRKSLIILNELLTRSKPRKSSLIR